MNRKKENKKGYFITGTDTEVGKTFVTFALGTSLKNKGFDIGVMKPVQCSGRDAQVLKKGLKIQDPLKMINPYYAREPVSPHLAFKRSKQKVDIHSAGRSDTYRPLVSAADMRGDLLYRSRLTAPFDSLELIFTIEDLPAGPGASVLGWVTLVIAVVFIGGFVALYRLGRGQIQLAQQQQDFVSAVSHELKTPLTSIRMYGELLKEGWADEDKRHSYYVFIHDEAERLSRMIANVLQLAKISRNEPQFDLQPINVGELLGNVESKISNQVASAGFTLDVTRDERAVQAMLRIDEDCFAQIVINLVDNAIKFSKNAEKKAIELSCTQNRGDSIVFAIRDYGPGIPRDQLKKIFELFYRSESELTRETVGTGIGLAIVRELTLGMSGSLDVINCQPGVEFRISFPTFA